MWSLSSDLILELPCKSWGCSFCGWKKRQAAQIVLEAGVRLSWSRGHRTRFMTLTDGHGGAGGLSMADLYECWNRFRTRLKKSGELKEYAAVVELQERGALHLHAITTGSYIKQARLSDVAKEAGFGKVADIREIKATAAESDKKSIAYSTKEMAGYLSKQKAAALLVKTNKRRRPLRVSKGWGMSLGEAEHIWAEAMAAKTGKVMQNPELLQPWAYIQAYADGSVRVTLNDERTMHRPPGATSWLRAVA